MSSSSQPIPFPVSTTSKPSSRRSTLGALSSRFQNPSSTFGRLVKLSGGFSSSAQYQIDNSNHHHHNNHSLSNNHSIKRLSSITNFLLSRSRTTNLAVLILSFLCSFSLYFNLKTIFGNQSPSISPTAFGYFNRNSKQAIESVTHPAPSLENSSLKNLIIVPGHSIYHGTKCSENQLDPGNWLLEPYQLKNSRFSINSFINHIQTGISVASNDQDSLLVYSGGQTKPKSNQTTTESGSYLKLAENLQLYDKLNFDPKRSTTEEFALDSWTNLVYSLCRFKEYTGNYPSHITVVGNSIKSKRFQDLHLKALRWPIENFKYIQSDKSKFFINKQNKEKNLPEYEEWAKEVGVDHEKGDEQDERYFKELIEGERKVYLQFENDLYSCHDKLYEKKLKRNPFRRFHSYRSTCPEIAELLDWCPINGNTPFPGKLPWL